MHIKKLTWTSRSLATLEHESLVTVLNSRVYFTGKQNELQENKMLLGSPRE